MVLSPGESNEAPAYFESWDQLASSDPGDRELMRLFFNSVLGLPPEALQI